MAGAPHPRMHGAAHVPGGPDPIPGMAVLGPSYEAIVLGQPSLVGYWPLNDPSAPAVDRGPLHHDLEAGGTPEFERDFGVLFDSPNNFSIDDFLRDDDSAFGTNPYQFTNRDPYTWIIVVNPSALPNGSASPGPGIWGVMTVYNYPSGSVGGMRLNLKTTSGAATIQEAAMQVVRAGTAYTGPTVFTLDPDHPEEPMLPTFIAMSYDGTNLKLYYNGALAGEFTNTSNHNASGLLTLGTYYDGSFYGNYQGWLGEAAIFNEALDPATIDQLSRAARTSNHVDSLAVSGGVRLTGDVELLAGTGITLTRIGQKIRISLT